MNPQSYNIRHDKHVDVTTSCKTGSEDTSFPGSEKDGEGENEKAPGDEVDGGILRSNVSGVFMFHLQKFIYQ